MLTRSPTLCSVPWSPSQDAALSSILIFRLSLDVSRTSLSHSLPHTWHTMTCIFQLLTPACFLLNLTLFLLLLFCAHVHCSDICCCVPLGLFHWVPTSSSWWSESVPCSRHVVSCQWCWYWNECYRSPPPSLPLSPGWPSLPRSLSPLSRLAPPSLSPLQWHVGCAVRWDIQSQLFHSRDLWRLVFLPWHSASCLCKLHAPCLAHSVYHWIWSPAVHFDPSSQTFLFSAYN